MNYTIVMTDKTKPNQPVCIKHVTGETTLKEIMMLEKLAFPDNPEDRHVDLYF
jgi:hypothetical protein